VDEETSTIKQHIDKEREELGRNLDEIELRVKHATDFKTYFDRNTGWILGAAVAGGFLLSAIFRKSPRDESPWEPTSAEDNVRVTRSRVPTHLSRVSETLDNIFAGLVGVASERLQSVVADAVPGFREQYDEVQRQRGPSSVHRIKPKFGVEGEVAR
jgi:hypothetical protein